MVARKRTAALKLRDYYMGRDKLYRNELTRELRSNARNIVQRFNRLLRRAGITATTAHRLRMDAQAVVAGRVDDATIRYVDDSAIAARTTVATNIDEHAIGGATGTATTRCAG